MSRRKLYCAIICFFIIALASALFCPLYAEDELVLIGILKSINPKTNTVIVEVKSSSCRGLRTFTVGNAIELDDFINQKIRFQIDSSVCKKDTLYRMLPGVGVTK
ncbi:MAG: hypothetical protein WC539_08785 [Nitrospirota bacterium]